MKKVIEDYIASYNSFDIDGMLLNMHEEIAFKNISDGQVNLSTTGLIELRAAAEKAKKIFKSRCQTITHYLHSGDRTTIEIDYVGEIASDIPKGPKAGETINLKGKSEFEVKDGLIVKLTDIS